MSNILILTEEYPPFKGGVGRFMHQLASCLEGNNVHVVSSIKEVASEKLVIPLSFSSSYIWPRWIPAFIKITKLCRKHRVTHILASSVLPYGLIAFLVSLCCNASYSVVVVGMDILHIKKNFLRKILAKLVLQKSNSVISISNFTTKQLTSYNVKEQKIHLVHPRAFCSPEKHAPQEIQELSSKIAGKKVILSVGRLVKRKNFNTIISIAEKFIKDPSTVFVIVGDGPEKQNLVTQIKDKHLEKIVFIVQANDNELAWLYRKCRCVVFLPISSLATGDVEGFGIVAIEAASFGKPTIASNQGGVPDAVQDKKTGILVSPSDIENIQRSLNEILNDDVYYRSMAENANIFYNQQFSQHLQQQGVLTALGIEKKSNISVVIPAYNAEKTIQACLCSIQEQDLEPLEIIVVNDGSTDKTRQIIENQFPNVILINKENGGAPTARNAGAQVANGEYLIFIDSDITCRHDMLSKMKKMLVLHPEISYAYSSFKFGWKKFSSFSFNPDLLRKHNYIHTSSLIRKKDFPGFDESLTRHQDWDLWLTMLEQNKRGVLIPEYLYSIHLQKKRISSWLPSFFYSLSFFKHLSRVEKYERSANVIRKKHQL